jgi:hypothetical protein
MKLLERSESLNEADGLGDNGSVSGMSITTSSPEKASGFARPVHVDPVVAEKEQRAVFWSRVVVISVLVISVATLAATMYMIISRSEQSHFETQVWLVRHDVTLFLLFGPSFSKPISSMQS